MNDPRDPRDLSVDVAVREALEAHRRYMEERKYQTPYGGMPMSPYAYGNGLLGLIPFVDSSLKSDVPPPLPEDHLVSAITAYRAWNVPLFCDELRSVAKPAKWWPYRRFEAKCSDAAQCSGVDCQCGIYAFNSLELVTREYRGEGRTRKYVYGEVWLWGRVLECKMGYRAQFAYPKAFVNTGAIAKRMAEVFGVPLIK